jgi:predicted Zn-dependent protease
MMDAARAMEVLDRVLGLARADDVTVELNGGTTSTTRFADNVITQNVRKEDAALCIECAFGTRHASVSTNDLSDKSLHDAARRACEAAMASPPDPEHMQPMEAEESQKYADVNAWVDGTDDFDPEGRAEAVARAARRVGSEGYRLSGALTSSAGVSALGNNRGLRAFFRSTMAEMHATVLGENGSGWADRWSNDVRDVDPVRVAEEALGIARAAQDPADIKPGRYTVILRPAAVLEMIPGFMVCDAKATDEGRTFQRGMLGKKVCGENITIRSDPARRDCPASPFLGDGMAARALPWVERGVLVNLATSRYWAKMKGRVATGSPANLIMEGTDRTLEEMIAATDDGILVTRFWYIRDVDPMRCLLTGMTRDGLFRIEGGRISRPLKQMRFNESVPEVLARVDDIGRPERAGGWALVPPLKIRDFRFTSGTTF